MKPCYAVAGAPGSSLGRSLSGGIHPLSILSRTWAFSNPGVAALMFSGDRVEMERRVPFRATSSNFVEIVAKVANAFLGGGYSWPQILHNAMS